MRTKLTTESQVALLKEGDIVVRFPSDSNEGPLNDFDETRTKNISTFEIRTKNTKTGIFLLISANVRTLLYAAPVDIGRLYIKDEDLLAEKTWWINT